MEGASAETIWLTRPRVTESGWLITCGSTSLANAVSVNGSAAAACQGPDCRALLSASKAADKRACSGAAGRSQLISMLLPEASTVPMTVPHAA